MTQRFEMLNGHGQQLATQPEPLMARKQSKNHDFARASVAETVTDQSQGVFGNEPRQLTLSNLSGPRFLGDAKFRESRCRHCVLTRETTNFNARGDVLRYGGSEEKWHAEVAEGSG